MNDNCNARPYEEIAAACYLNLFVMVATFPLGLFRRGSGSFQRGDGGKGKT